MRLGRPIWVGPAGRGPPPGAGRGASRRGGGVARGLAARRAVSGERPALARAHPGGARGGLEPLRVDRVRRPARARVRRRGTDRGRGRRGDRRRRIRTHQTTGAAAHRGAAAQGGGARAGQRAQPAPARDSRVHLPAHLGRAPGAPVTLPRTAAAEHAPETGDLALDASSRLDAWIAVARGWAGPERLALILSGSHARGDAVWTEVAGR